MVCRTPTLHTDNEMKSRLKKKLLKKSLYVCEVVDWEHWRPNNITFHDGERVLMLGEIEQMPGHVAVVKEDGRVMWGYHIENFRRISREEA